MAKRIEKGITVEQLAKEVGVTRDMISKIESGTKNPSLKTIKNIGAALGLDFGQLDLF